MIEGAPEYWVARFVFERALARDADHLPHELEET